MPDPMVSTVESLGIDSVDLPHAARERRAARLDQQVVMVVHQTIRPQRPVETIAGANQTIQKSLPILIIEVDRLTCITARHHVIERTGKFNAKGTSHGARLHRHMWQNKT